MRPFDVRIPLLALAATAALGCASSQKPSAVTATPAAAPTHAPAAPRAVAPPPRAPEPIDSGLSFTVEPSSAEIAIDGNSVGTVADVAASGGLLRLAPGIYQVSLKAPGYVTWRAEVALRSGTEAIRVKLNKKQ